MSTGELRERARVLLRKIRGAEFRAGMEECEQGSARRQEKHQGDAQALADELLALLAPQEPSAEEANPMYVPGQGSASGVCARCGRPIDGRPCPASTSTDARHWIDLTPVDVTPPKDAEPVAWTVRSRHHPSGYFFADTTSDREALTRVWPDDDVVPLYATPPILTDDERAIWKEQARQWGALTEAMSVEFADEPESVPGRNVGECAVNLIRRLLATPPESEAPAMLEALKALNDNVGDLANSAVRAKVAKALGVPFEPSPAASPTEPETEELPVSFLTWLEHPRTGAEIRVELLQRLGDLCGRLDAEARALVGFASGMLARALVDAEPWNGCFTGDCPHETADECVQYLAGYVAELEREATSRDAEQVTPPWNGHLTVYAPGSGIVEIQASGERRPIVKWAGFDESFVPESVHQARARYLVDAANARAAGAAIREALERLLYAHSPDFAHDHDAAVQHGHDVLNALVSRPASPTEPEKP